MKLILTLADYTYAILLKMRSYLMGQTKNLYLPSATTTVVIIPGIYESWSYFQHLTRYLRGRFNIIYSDVTVGTYGTLEEQASRLSDYLHEQHLEGVVLIGHSSGGIVAALCCETAPKRVKGIISIACPYNGVLNGHLLRTGPVRQLLPSSPTIQKMKVLSATTLHKIVALYPAFDNQIWNRDGKQLGSATNEEVAASGHHLVLRSQALQTAIGNHLN